MEEECPAGESRAGGWTTIVEEAWGLAWRRTSGARSLRVVALAQEGGQDLQVCNHRGCTAPGSWREQGVVDVVRGERDYHDLCEGMAERGDG